MAGDERQELRDVWNELLGAIRAAESSFERAIEDSGDLLPQTDVDEIRSQLAEMKRAAETGDLAACRAAMQRFESNLFRCSGGQ